VPESSFGGVWICGQGPGECSRRTDQLSRWRGTCSRFRSAERRYLWLDSGQTNIRALAPLYLVTPLLKWHCILCSWWTGNSKHRWSERSSSFVWCETLSVCQDDVVSHWTEFHTPLADSKGGGSAVGAASEIFSKALFPAQNSSSWSCAFATNDDGADTVLSADAYLFQSFWIRHWFRLCFDVSVRFGSYADGHIWLPAHRFHMSTPKYFIP